VLSSGRGGGREQGAGWQGGREGGSGGAEHCLIGVNESLVFIFRGIY